MKHIIIGGVAGGATAATRLRRLDENAEIVLIEKGEYISYANCGLPYYIGNVITEREQLFVQTPQGFAQRFAIDVRTLEEVVNIDTAGHEVHIRRANGSTYTERYDKLLLSPGAEPIRPPMEGIDAKGVFTLRNVEDTDAIYTYLKNNAVRHATVIGGGFIGLEMVENLHRRGIMVSLVERDNQVMGAADFSTVAHLHRHMEQHGVKLYLGESMERIVEMEDGLEIHLASQQKITTDLVLLSIGVRPHTALAKASNITIGERGIQVNEYLQTSAPDVFAIGDAIEFLHPVTKKPWCNFLAGPANRQGRLAADNMSQSVLTSYEGAIGTAIAKVFDLTIGITGLSARTLQREGIAYDMVVTSSNSHAGYYPGAYPLQTKLLFDKTTGKLLGAQCVGTEGVDKRIDQLAMVIKNKGTVSDLTRLEHAYAPPFSSAKDPIAIAGYVATNVLNGHTHQISWRTLQQKVNDGALLLDVRTTDEFSFGTIAGAINIPLDDLRNRLSELPKDKDIVVFCAVGQRGYVAERILKGNGFERVYNLAGGYRLYCLTTPTDIATTEKATPLCPIQEEFTIQETKQGSVLHVDACGLQCPGPILKVKQTMDALTVGQRIEVVATDAGFARDAAAWCKTTGNNFISSDIKEGRYIVTMEKGSPISIPQNINGGGKGKTFILFSDNLDRALATFVLANGAAATGQKVSIFFTFWGLNVLKRKNKPLVKKDFISRMFAWMMPSHSEQLKLSKMSFGGLGDRLMRWVMKNKGIDQLESLRQQALDNGVEFIACQMTMDMMGIAREELLPNVEIGGVATYMERADNANVNLFI
ncbi:MAG: FAD-dependent oxidoreductase [Alloprevotella sp.]|nr:FAD-dependent oxidoreductase [Alloprevotella sp.]